MHSIDPTKQARIAIAFAAVALAACSPAAIVPGTVDQELPAFAVTDCLSSASTCQARGDVRASLLFSSDAPTAILLEPGSGIDASFARPDFQATLHAVAFGVRAIASADQDGAPSVLQLRIDGLADPLELTSGDGTRRIEIQVPLHGDWDASAKLHVDVLRGAFELAYVEGLWNRR